MRGAPPLIGRRLKGADGEISEFRKIAVERAAALLAGKSCQFVRFFEFPWRFDRRAAQARPRPCESRAQTGRSSCSRKASQSGVAIEKGLVHPLVALFEHVDELVFEIGPIVVAPQKQCFDGSAQSRIVFSDLLDSAACGAAIKFLRLLVDFQASAESGENRLLHRNFAAKGVDGRNAQLRGKVEKIPTQGTRTRQRALRQ